MTTDIKIVTTQASNGDCELGCWNEGYGGIVEIDGKRIFAKEAWATCTDNSELTLGDLFSVVLKHFGIDANLTIEDAHPDDYEYDDFEDEE